jgi:hypothetical protein
MFKYQSMKKFNARQLLIILSLSGIFYTWQGCKNYNEEDLYPNGPCDTTNVTYTASIKPILSANCYICHSTDIATAGIILDDSLQVANIARSGLLFNVVNHTAGYPQMPKDQPQLSSCNILKIRIWTDKGAPLK